MIQRALKKKSDAYLIMFNAAKFRKLEKCDKQFLQRILKQILKWMLTYNNGLSNRWSYKKGSLDFLKQEGKR